MKLAILTPSARDPKWGYISSMGAMEDYIRVRGICGQRPERMVRVVNKQCSLLPQGRQMCLDVAMQGGFTHALWLDDDTEFPADTMDLLARWMVMSLEPVKAVGVNYTKKCMSPEYTAVRNKIIISSDAPATGIEPVDSCGLGALLLDLSALENIPAPHFEILWNAEDQCYVGEDRYFFHKLNAAGVQVYVDHDLSRMVNHIGDYGYGQVGRKLCETQDSGIFRKGSV